MKSIIESNSDIINNIREIYENADPRQYRKLIEKHFIPTIEEKKKYAEVPTPVILVDKMLSKIPRKFWKTVKKILEPCCGKGNFVLGIFYKLYDGLVDLYPNEYDRCKVIIEECLYYADISTLNVFITTEILKCEVQSRCGECDFSDWKFNTFVGDTIELNIQDKWSVQGFDAVIGNPPYNNSCGNKGQGNTLWDKFVDKSLNSWLKKDGYLVFVHPQGWRQLNNKIGLQMLSKQLLYLNMNDVNEGVHVFRCSTTFDYYVLQNCDVHKDTLVNDYKNNEYNYNLSNMKFVPNHSIVQVNKYIDYSDKHGIIKDRSIYGTEKKWMSKTKNEIFKYPCVYSINKNNEISFRYSNVNDKGHFGISKFIISNGSGFYKDIEGQYGCTEWSYYIKCNQDDMDNIEKCLNSDEFKNLIDAVKLTSNKYNYSILQYLKYRFWCEFI
jgi:hypothetical protein